MIFFRVFVVTQGTPALKNLYTVRDRRFQIAGTVFYSQARSDEDQPRLRYSAG